MHIVLVSLSQMIGTMHNICKVHGSNFGHHKKKNIIHIAIVLSRQKQFLRPNSIKKKGKDQIAGFVFVKFMETFFFGLSYINLSVCQNVGANLLK